MGTSFRLVKLFAIIIGAEAFIVITGWILGLEKLTRIFSFGVNMKFLTALLFFFSAWCLYFISESLEKRNELLRNITRAMGFLIFLEMFLILLSNLLILKIPVQDLFVVQQNTSYGLGVGTPSILTIINFLLFGITSVFYSLHERLGHFMLKLFGGTILVVGLGSIIGYILNIPLMYYQFTPTTIPMAFNTALSFILLGLALIILGKTKSPSIE